jgi:hypothetical protein
MAYFPFVVEYLTRRFTMRFRLPSLLVPVLILVLSVSLAACGDSTVTEPPPTQAVAATPTVKPTVRVTTVAAATIAAATATVKVSSEYLPPYGCLPAVTITDVVVQACLDKPGPNQNDTLQLTTRMSMAGAPVVGAPIKTTWNFKAGKQDCAATSDKDGVGFCYKKIGTAEVGFRVVVEVQYDYKGTGYRAETSFTPIGAAAQVAPTTASR